VEVLGEAVGGGNVRELLDLTESREVVLVDTGALCSEIYTPELFTRVRRPIWPLDPISDPRAA